MKLNLRAMFYIGAAILVVIVGAFYYFATRPHEVITGGGSAPAAIDTAALMEAGPLGDMTLGDPKAPNTVIEYASMTCSHCQNFHQTVYPEFKSKYVDTGKAYFIFRDYPLDPLAAAAIVTAHCVPKERFFPIVDLLFDHQSEWAFVKDPVTALQNQLKQAGFTEKSFKACLTNQSLLDGVNWVKERATKQFGVDATPTFFINGKRYAGELTLDELDKALGG